MLPSRFIFFPYGYQVVPVPFVGKRFLSPWNYMELSSHFNWPYMCESISRLYILLQYLSNHMPIPCWNNYCRIIAILEIKWYRVINIAYLFFSFLKFCWNRVGLQCCGNVCCTTKWFSYTDTHIHSSSDSCHTDYHRILGRVLCAIQQVTTGQSFYIPQYAYVSPKPPAHPSLQPVPFGNHKFVFKICESVSVLQIRSFVSFFFF